MRVLALAVLLAIPGLPALPAAEAPAMVREVHWPQRTCSEAPMAERQVLHVALLGSYAQQPFPTESLAAWAAEWAPGAVIESGTTYRAADEPAAFAISHASWDTIRSTIHIAFEDAKHPGGQSLRGAYEPFRGIACHNFAWVSLYSPCLENTIRHELGHVMMRAAGLSVDEEHAIIHGEIGSCAAPG